MSEASTSALLLEARDKLRQRKRLNGPLYNAVREAEKLPKDSRKKMLATHHALMEAAVKSGKRLTDWDREYCKKNNIKTVGGYTKTDIAKQIGISPTNLNKHLRKSSAPKPESGRYDLDAVASFIASEQEKDCRNKNQSPDVAKAKADLIIYKAKQAKLEYEREAGLLVSKSEADRCMNTMATTIKNEGDQLRNKLPPLLAGKDLPDMSRIIDEAWRDVCRAIADAPLGEMETVNDENT